MGVLLLAHCRLPSRSFEAPGMPGQAPVRNRPLSGELLDSSEEGAWLPDPIAFEATRTRGGPEAVEARLFGWGELLGTWVEHLLTAIDIAILGDRVPTLLVLLDRWSADCKTQLGALKRFKRGVHQQVRVFVLYKQEFDWLFEAWKVELTPFYYFFGNDGSSRFSTTGLYTPEQLQERFKRDLAVDLVVKSFESPSESELPWRQRWLGKLRRCWPFGRRAKGTSSGASGRR